MRPCDTKFLKKSSHKKPKERAREIKVGGRTEFSLSFTFNSNSDLLQPLLSQGVLGNISVLKILEEPTQLRVCHTCQQQQQQQQLVNCLLIYLLLQTFMWLTFSKKFFSSLWIYYRVCLIRKLRKIIESNFFPLPHFMTPFLKVPLF